MRARFALLLLLLVCSLVGCSSKDSQIPGKWTSEVMGRKVAFDMKADKTFTSDDMEGTWALSSDKITLTVTKLGGKAVTATDAANPFAKPMEGTLAEDAKSFSLTTPLGAATFTKEAS